MAKDNPRARRLGEQIQRELGDLLRREVKDGRIGNVTITAVNVTGDLRIATSASRILFATGLIGILGSEGTLAGPNQRVI